MPLEGGRLQHGRKKFERVSTSGMQRESNVVGHSGVLDTCDASNGVLGLVNEPAGTGDNGDLSFQTTRHVSEDVNSSAKTKH
ncbi:hypothetical protein BC938DRAFT_481737 [Jimgerdemannia flammicorona]|uniref:Uncharacterized protein n=1 Tax=Jimgerdemannia flammicorona TaxID=994334 RepID=A0A433QWU4_9FUNG|nr:hypothetical protein BC938DRAFT_481737 [Jimgerdemannia flammicorona]